MHYCQSICLCLFISLLLNVTHSGGQSLEVKYAEFKNNKLLVHYSLQDSISGRLFTIRLYASKDNFLNPLEKVTGDVGLEVKPGPDNIITWDAHQEFESQFEGKVALEVRGRIFVPFINTENINQYRVYKRKRKYNITWTGGTPQNILNFDLYNGEKKIITYPNLANVGSYSLEFPSYIKPKRNYRFRISDSKNKEDVVYTSDFKIKRKIPLLIKLISGAVAGSALYFLINSKSSEGDIPPFPSDNLPKK